MLLHNSQLANPLNEYAKRLKAASKKRNKTDEDMERLARIEFDAGWYLGARGEYIIPAHNIEATMVAGARAHKNGKAVTAGSFVVDDAVLKFDGSDKDRDALWAGGKHALMCSVVVSRRRVMRTRPMVPSGWTTRVTVRFDPRIVDEEIIMQALETGGIQCAFGDWRPKYGRFSVERAR
jgi:hypothetical protein